ncbi:MAG: DUF2293 domain-containing protein [Planctomycetota bacterium]|nr:DUF2293 domain-containing protein [Planctomycetota bacterium]
MPDQTRIVSPGPRSETVLTTTGEILVPPADWSLLLPGDPGLTRRVKAAGASWTVQEKRGRKTFSQGVWAPRANIATAIAQLAAERSTDAYAKRQVAGAKRREKIQTVYVHTFRDAVFEFLSFAPTHRQLAEKLADAVAEHATPVGSGTVARTQRIPVERRAEAAVIAWLRHQTTMYDEMTIARIKGERREVRRILAQQSRQMLRQYRDGIDVPPGKCELRKALAKKTV